MCVSASFKVCVCVLPPVLLCGTETLETTENNIIQLLGSLRHRCVLYTPHKDKTHGKLYEFSLAFLNIYC